MITFACIGVLLLYCCSAINDNMYSYSTCINDEVLQFMITLYIHYIYWSVKDKVSVL